jgi:hypothetical protein
MLTPELMDRVQLLQADLAQVRRQSQARGSGATIHRVSNQVATAHGALQLVEARCDEAKANDIEQLLALAEACLRTARILIAQTSQRL